MTTLRQARLGKGLEPRQAATKLGINYKTYSAYETGRNSPKPARALKIEKFFGTKIEFGKSGEEDATASGVLWKAIGVLEKRVKDLEDEMEVLTQGVGAQVRGELPDLRQAGQRQ